MRSDYSFSGFIINRSTFSFAGFWPVFIFFIASGNLESPPVTASANGNVYGSVMITVSELPEDDNRPGIIAGQRTGTSTYAVKFSKETKLPFKRNRVIRGKPGEEVFFFKSLPAGNYIIHTIAREGFSSLALTGLKIRFTVESGETTYIGKLHIPFPHRIAYGTRVNLKIEDNEDETTNHFFADHQSEMINHLKKLMIMD